MTLDFPTLVAVRLAKEGMFGGDPQRVLRAPCDLVFASWHFLQFQSEYEETLTELNRPT